ncbi:DUF2180 family protein [Streptomyces ardesiacus]
MAVCCVCGVGICPRHAHARTHLLHQLNGMAVATRHQAARRLLCGTCSTAERS